MNTTEFTRMFGSGQIRARLDWSRITEPDVLVEQDFHTSVDRLAEMTTMWYADAEGRPVDYAAPNASPLTVREAAALDMSTVPRREEDLSLYTDRAARSPAPVQLVLAAYYLYSGSHLILDGTHRAVAAIRARAPAAVFSFVLRGPLDAAILPDLSHHLAGDPLRT
ncbi:hypothetical protein [Streptomyces sp. NBC_01198]|uniref:hypothetical protein n=1 Tax=Streptomyces sp. NBC_01198 TaxID=2903769 RepID=UPI002E0DF901|nr:hypothetical protein OG702_00730 [Streptomyces sp. NBC_01198]